MDYALDPNTPLPAYVEGPRDIGLGNKCTFKKTVKSWTERRVDSAQPLLA